MPTSVTRFAKLTRYDNVRHDRLPALLQNSNPTGKTWRNIDGNAIANVDRQIDLRLARDRFGMGNVIRLVRLKGPREIGSFERSG